MRIRSRLLGLFATLLVLAILIGLPTVLLHLGANPIPRSLPSWDQVRAAFATPDDGTLALAVIKIIAWAAWAVLTVSIVLEVISRARGIRVPTLPGLSVPQGLARQLVGAAALLFVIVPAATNSASADAAQAGANGPAAAAITAPATVPHPATTSPESESHRPYVVQDGDTLSRIAQRHLGDAERWPEIVTLNPALRSHPDLIHPGQRLNLPATHPPVPTRSYVVRAGDTLTGIAKDAYGDPDRYPEIFAASQHTLQPGGVHLTDPDQIDVGQRLTIPGTTPAPVSAPAPAPAPTPGGATPVHPEPSNTPSQVPAPPAPTPPVPAGAAQSAPPAADAETASHSPWMVAGLTGGGALLAGSLLLHLRRRRRAQFRSRRPGRTLANPETVLAPVEKTITVVGASTAPTVEQMDQVLRRLAAAAATNRVPMPVLAAVELTASDLVLHLAEPTDLSPPWQGTPDRLHWRIKATTPLDMVGPELPDQPAPYPLLVTVGLGDAEELWLLNIEDLDVTVAGDPTYGQDFARYLAAEVACNPWSAGVNLSCLGVATELAALNPDRVRVLDPSGTSYDPVQDLLADAVAVIDRTAAVDLDVNTARASQAGADAWPAQVLLVDATSDSAALTQLLELVHQHPGRTGTSVVVRGARPDAPGIVLEVTSTGRVRLAEAGLDLVAVGLTSDEAAGCAALLAHSELVDDVPVPVDDTATDGWQSYADAAGALRTEHALPRSRPDGDEAETAATLLAEPDEAYVEVAATTVEDLQVLAPRVSAAVRHDVEEADPALDDDVAMWFRDDSALPKLRLLGPVRATTRGKPLLKRKPYMTELLAFIALRRHGATPEEVAETFSVNKSKARDYVNTVRYWLGTNPRTGQQHLPDARKAPAAEVRDVPVYQVIDLLIDADLFRRLRVRGEARGGTQGIADLQTALRLVEGRPFDYPLEREAAGGWAWLVEGERLDKYMTGAIVDVAHVVTTHALAEGDIAAARLAAETAALAAPHEEIPRLDLAAVATAEGRDAEAKRIIRDEVCNRTDDDGPPPELPPRTAAILAARKGWIDTKAS